MPLSTVPAATLERFLFYPYSRKLDLSTLHWCGCEEPYDDQHIYNEHIHDAERRSVRRARKTFRKCAALPPVRTTAHLSEGLCEQRPGAHTFQPAPKGLRVAARSTRALHATRVSLTGATRGHPRRQQAGDAPVDGTLPWHGAPSSQPGISDQPALRLGVPASAATTCRENSAVEARTGRFRLGCNA